MTLSSDSDIANEMLQKDFNGSVTLFSKSDTADFNGIARGASDSIYSTQFQDEEVRMKIHNSSKAILVLTDTYYPGWKCFVNGREEKIHRVNKYMRGVIIGPGNNVVDFRFEPDTFRAGFGLSAAAFFISFCAMFLMRKQFRTRRNPN
jgi:uncharacterized membrane protein YfhO